MLLTNPSLITKTKQYSDAMGDISSVTDDELAFLLKQSNSAAFEKIYSKYWDRLFDYAYKRLNNAELCEEIVQEIFIRLWDRRESLEFTTGLMNYLFTAARYSVIDQYRRQLVQNSFIAASKYNLHIDNSTEERIFVNDLKKYLDDLIGTLPPKCKSVYELSRLQYKTNKEIAEILHISEKTVEGHLTKALQRLRVGMGELLFFAVAFFLK